MPDAPAERRLYVFHGRVQGVFFRATTAELARGRPLSGWVRNRPDGTVELQVQGAGAALDALVAAIQERYTGSIERADQRPQPIEPAERGFEIRH